MADLPIDGDYEAHVRAGLCPSLHDSGAKRYMCAGVAGHYNFVTSKHYARGIAQINGALANFVLEWS